jgi:[acyl-carrier-protein] S-malonyltransferase
VSDTFALVFPGQGSQRRGMLDGLPDADGLGRLLDAAEALSGLDLRRVAADGTPDQLADTRAAQPLLYLADWAWGSGVLAAGLRPVAVAGHSLGELAALAIAGVFSAEAGLELVIERSTLMAACAAETPGGMSAVLGLDGRVVSGVLEPIDGVWLANDNCPGQVVISGTSDGIARATAALAEAGARRIVPLNVAGPFHSPLMAPAGEAFARVLAGAHLADAAVPVVQNADPTLATAADSVRERLSRQIVSPVRWTETMAALAAAGASVLVEAGPGTVLAGLARRVDGLVAYSIEESGIDAINEEVHTR